MEDYSLNDEKRGREIDDLLAEVRSLIGEAPENPAEAKPEPAPQPPAGAEAQTAAPERPPLPDPDATRRFVPPTQQQTVRAQQSAQSRPAAAQPEQSAAAQTVQKPAVRERQPDREGGAQKAPQSERRPAAQKERQPEKESVRREKDPGRPLSRAEKRELRRQAAGNTRYDTEPPTGYFWSTSRAALYVLCVLAVSVLLAIGLWVAADDVLALTSADTEAQVTVVEGESLSAVADSLADAGLIRYPFLFRIYGRLFHADEKIQPGVYTLNDMYDYRALVVGMMGSYTPRETARVTIPEGYTADQIFELLEQAGVCTKDELTAAAAEGDLAFDFLRDSQVEGAQRLEGCLFPDTYEFYLNDDPVNVLSRMLTNFDQKFTDEMRQRLTELNAELSRKAAANGISGSFSLTVGDIVTVASLIEKEAAVAAERTTVASVIYNRLTNPNFPKLQIDATVHYALGQWSEALTYSDLETDSPYNTYLYAGLPVGPICNPGMNCLKAALYPTETTYYYYALGSDGTHHFSETAAEHEEFLTTLED